jgi:aspartate kinase
LRERFGGRVRLVEHVGALSVIGAGINASFENLRRGCDALHSAGIAWSGVATSSFRITWMIDGGKLDDAVRLLHRVFLEEPAPLVP